MKERYLPLVIASDAEDGADYMEQLRSCFGVGLGADMEAFADFIISDNFCRREYDGEFKEVNQLLVSGMIYNILNFYPSGYMEKHGLSPLTEARDILGFVPVVKLWSKNKKVYKLAPGFFEELLRTQDSSGVPSSVFSHLPFNTFYMDLSRVNSLGNIVGAFVHVSTSQDDLGLAVYMVTENREMFSYYKTFRDDGSGQVSVDLDNVDELQGLSVLDISLECDGTIRSKMKNAGEDFRRRALKGIMQCLIFLSIPTAHIDVSENEVTKRTYKPRPPHSAIRNKFSEVQIFDVGIRYSKAISAAKKKLSGIQRNSGMPLPQMIENRKPPRPHVRCAHWQRYHVGAGRKEIRINWIPPTFVCGKQSIDVTITPIMKDELDH